MLLIALFTTAYYLRLRAKKKNKQLVAARIAEEKEKDHLNDLRRDSRRRQWALALADLLSHRNGLPTKGVQLALKLDDDQRRHLTQQVKKELGLHQHLDGAVLRQQIAEILRCWPAGMGNSPRTFTTTWRPRAGFATRWRSTACAPPF